MMNQSVLRKQDIHWDEKQAHIAWADRKVAADKLEIIHYFHVRQNK